MTKKTSQPKRPRPASTVILAREHEGEVQVFLLRRSGTSGFFPGNYVFPGGTIEPEDHNLELWQRNLDMDLSEVSRRLGGGLGVNEALGFGVAAIRETFEEAGVLLAYRSEGMKDGLEEVCDGRMTIGLSRGWLEALVRSEGWTLALTRLGRWAHWITPELMPYRFDTRFFLVFMPLGQECTPDARETTHGIWINPARGLARNLEGEIPLSPPTLITLHELLPYRDMEAVEKAVEDRVWGEALLPRLIPHSQGPVILEPWDPLYHEEIEIDPKRLVDSILPPGEPFSRVWLHEGIWKPVGV